MVSDPELEILHTADPPSGVQGVRVLTVAVKTTSAAAPVVFRAKWRSWATAEGFSTPRKEVAAHALQKLLFAPREEVVPPTRVACLPLAVVRRHLDPDALCEEMMSRYRKPIDDATVVACDLRAQP